MSEWLARAGELFVAPAASQPARAAAARLPAPPSAVVLGTAGAAAPLARLLATALRARTGSACALSAVWSAGAGGEPPAGPAGREARAVAARLEGRGLRASARGRAVGLALPPEPGEAIVAWGRARAATACPAVLAIGGARPPELEPALSEADLILVVTAGAQDDPLRRLALAGLEICPAPVVVAPPLAPVLARLAISGSPGLGRALGTDVLGAVRALA